MSPLTRSVARHEGAESSYPRVVFVDGITGPNVHTLSMSGYPIACRWGTHYR